MDCVRGIWMTDLIRRATADDAAACAAIIDAWIEQTDWMPRRITYSELVPMFREGLPKREAYVIGNPIEGYLSMDDTAHIWGFYVARRGAGLGAALMDRAKAERDFVSLNTHLANRRAHQFYAREGFERTGAPWDGDDGIPEIRMEWRA